MLDINPIGNSPHTVRSPAPAREHVHPHDRNALASRSTASRQTVGFENRTNVLGVAEALGKALEATTGIEPV
jgi:hypothetical protein